VAFGKDLEDELGSPVGQSEVAELVQEEDVDPGIASDNA
jgi:hypothetical protein